MATKIYVRQRRKIEEGERRPRFRIIGVCGGDVKLYAKHVRKAELDQITADSGAQVIYLEDKKNKTGKTS